MSRTGAFPHKGSMILQGDIGQRSVMMTPKEFGKRSEDIKFAAFESTRNTHLIHRTEEIYTDDERPYLKDPGWPRNDFSPNFLNYMERKATPNVSCPNIR
jgi:hypothetical protein